MFADCQPPKPGKEVKSDGIYAFLIKCLAVYSNLIFWDSQFSLSIRKIYKGKVRTRTLTNSLAGMRRALRLSSFPKPDYVYSESAVW
jgi:hypothetical protein